MDRPRRARRRADCRGADAAAGMAAVDSHCEAFGRPAEPASGHSRMPSRPARRCAPYSRFSTTTSPRAPPLVRRSSAFRWPPSASSLSFVSQLSRSPRRQTPSTRRPSPLLLVHAGGGGQALLAYSIASGVDPRYPAVLRYAFLALFIPIALVTAFFELEHRRGARVVVGLLLVLCAVLNTRDNWRIIDEYRHALPNVHRLLADDLVARRHSLRLGAVLGRRTSPVSLHASA